MAVELMKKSSKCPSVRRNLCFGFMTFIVKNKDSRKTHRFFSNSACVRDRDISRFLLEFPKEFRVTNSPKLATNVSKSPTWSPKTMPTWLYRQDLPSFIEYPL
ncbi:hypothetical protein TNCV_441371 [Trichonephila clavipes]|nr:hypothetical protein TNCV_441371 [Trichonephila clavipes]